MARTADRSRIKPLGERINATTAELFSQIVDFIRSAILDGGFPIFSQGGAFFGRLQRGCQFSDPLSSVRGIERKRWSRRAGRGF